MAQPRPLTLEATLLNLIDEKDHRGLYDLVSSVTFVDSSYADFAAVLHCCRILNQTALDILLIAGARTYDDRKLWRFNQTSVFWAFKHNSSTMAQSLLRHGFSLRCIDATLGSFAVEILWTASAREAVVNLILNAYADQEYNPADRNDFTIAHVACMRGKHHILAKFLEFDLSVTERRVNMYHGPFAGSTALHLSVLYGRYQQTKMLLQKGAAPLTFNRKNRTPLHYASYREDKDLVRIIFDHINIEEEPDNPIDVSGISWFHIACWLAPAKILQRLIDTERYDLNGCVTRHTTEDYRHDSLYGYSPLHFAVMGGDIEKVEILLAKGVNPSIKAPYKDTLTTPLSIAVKLNFKEAIDALTKVLYLKDVESVAHDPGFAKLYSAIFETYSCVKLPDLGHWELCPPLHYAVVRRDSEMVEALLKAGADANTRNDQGMTPLILACILTSKMLPYVKKLTMRVESHRKLSERMKKWFCHRYSPQTRVIHLLLKYKADINISDNEGRTPIFYVAMNTLFYWVNVNPPLVIRDAFFERNLFFIRLFLKRGANLTDICMGERTLIHYLCDVINLSDLFVTTEIARIKLLNLFIEEAKRNSDVGFDINAKDDKGATPLYRAVDNDLYFLAQELIKNGADVFAVTNRNYTILHATASSFGSSVRENFVRYVIGLGVDLDVQTSDNKSTVLHLAIRLAIDNNNELISMLLEHGASINLGDACRATALHYAVAANNTFAAEELANYGADMDAKNVVNETPLTLAGKMIADVNSWESALVTARFMYRMQVFGKNFNSQNEAFVNELAVSRTSDTGFHMAPVEDEIDRMKKKCFGEPGYSLYNLMSKSVFALRNFVKHKDLIEYIDSNSLITDFPLLGPIIAARMKRARMRHELLQTARHALVVILRLDIPQITDNVLRNFTDSELRKFIITSMEHPVVACAVEIRVLDETIIEDLEYVV